VVGDERGGRALLQAATGECGAHSHAVGTNPKFARRRIFFKADGLYLRVEGGAAVDSGAGGPRHSRMACEAVGYVVANGDARTRSEVTNCTARPMSTEAAMPICSAVRRAAGQRQRGNVRAGSRCGSPDCSARCGRPALSPLAAAGRSSAQRSAKPCPQQASRPPWAILPRAAAREPAEKRFVKR